jgi:anti-anti-sigma factor
MKSTHPQCDVDVERGRHITVVRVAGEVDLFGAPKLVIALRRAAAYPEPVVVDLSECEFLDTKGLDALLRARDADPRMVVVCPPDGSPARLLEISVAGDLRTHAGRADALTAVAA